MYSQVQVPIPIPIPINGNTRMCSQFCLWYFNLIILKENISWLIMYNEQNWYLYKIICTWPIPIPSKIAGIGAIPIPIPGIGAALLVNPWQSTVRCTVPLGALIRVDLV